ncbi:Aste57867_7900 [Aphanomyces stellatus]|uniref:Aste57867_7900 protein n=1 Tax=Aphanomyces stellatus TaxID=120398 RepID=A0A485KIY5_9STRA|nr:hypothetical protein As57867_007870 [Aphanomyces stellatus]VFT84793.1 Aste57867_7900 [Aphanomyces stellatus]
MRSSLQNHIQFLSPICSTLASDVPKPLPLQAILFVTFLVCLGLHYDLLFPASLKDRICTKVMHLHGPERRPWACTTYLEYSYIVWVALALQIVPVFVVLYLPWLWPSLWTLLFAFGSVLSCAFEELKEHLDDVEERMNEAIDAKQEHLGAGPGA